MKGYKAFEKGLICRGKQYAENTVFEEDEAIVCQKGMHFCKNPFDVLDHYPLVNDKGEFSDFAEVEALDEPVTDDNKKFCSKKLKIGAKLSFSKFVEAMASFEFEKIDETKVKTTKKDNAKIGSSGNYAKIGSSGNYAKIGSSGYSAQIGSSGNYAKIGSSGNYAQITSEGRYSVICCAGNGSTAKGKVGSWITLSEWEFDDNEGCYIPVCVKTEKIDGVKIKADTFYKLEKGEFIEVK